MNCEQILNIFWRSQNINFVYNFIIFMAHYLILDYERQQINNKQIIQKIQFIELSYNKQEQKQITVYQNLSDNFNFLSIVKKIVEIINHHQLEFQNITVIPLQQTYYEDFYNRFKQNNLQMPFVLCNYIYPKDFFQKKFNLKYSTLDDIAKYFCVKQYSSQSKVQLFHKIFNKFKLNSHLSNSNYEHSLISLNCFAYLKIQTYDKKVTRKFVIEKLLNGCINNQYEIFFVYANNWFAGYFILKVVKSYTEILVKRLNDHQDKEFKVQELNEDNFNAVLLNDQVRFNNYMPNFNGFNAQRKDQHKQLRQRRSRSREKDPKKYEFVIQKQMCAIKVRGLPFSFDYRDIHRFFQYYRPIKRSIKLGYRNDRKTGEAMIAFYSKNDALDSLKQDHATVMGRYLQIRLATHDQYDKF